MHHKHPNPFLSVCFSLEFISNKPIYPFMTATLVYVKTLSFLFTFSVYCLLSLSSTLLSTFLSHYKHSFPSTCPSYSLAVLSFLVFPLLTFPLYLFSFVYAFLHFINFLASFILSFLFIWSLLYFLFYCSPCICLCLFSVIVFIPFTIIFLLTCSSFTSLRANVSIYKFNFKIDLSHLCVQVNVWHTYIQAYHSGAKIGVSADIMSPIRP